MTMPSMQMEMQPQSMPVQPMGFQGYQAPQGNFQIQGKESQICHFPLPKNGTLLVESGAMRYMSPGITPELKMGQCMAACCGGESLFRVLYTNGGGQEGAMLGIAPNFNANIIPVSLEMYPRLTITGGAFLAATDTELQIRTERVKSVGGAFAGQGLLLHPLEGRGTVFLNAGGTIMFRTLAQGEVLYASTGSVVAFSEGVQFTVEMVGGGITNMCCGGEGLFNTKLVGPGLVIIQSLSFNELRAALATGNGNGGGGGCPCLALCL